jgi:hypothetical protein
MPAAKKTPSLFSAADVARVISRKLRKAGFLMADTSDRFRWTEGYRVHRIGCSKTVAVDYYTNIVSRTVEETERRREAVATVRKFLAEAGYPVATNGPVYIECERE